MHSTRWEQYCEVTVDLGSKNYKDRQTPRSLASETEALSPVTGEGSRCHPVTRSSGASLTRGKFLRSGHISRAPPRHHQGAEPPPRSPGHRHSTRSQSHSAREESPALRRRSQQPMEQKRCSEHFPCLATRANSHSSQAPRAEVPEGQCFLLMVVWFFSTKAGRKQRFNTWAQTPSGQRTLEGGKKTQLKTQG